MRQIIIILVLFLGIVGGGYFVLNPNDVYDNAAAVEMTEIVVDEGESNLTKRLPKEVMNETLDIEALLPDTEATTTENVNESNVATSTEIEEPTEADKPVLPSKTRTLKLADNSVSSGPTNGEVFLCETTLLNETNKAPWIQGDLWYPELKIKVEGDVFRKNANFLLESDGNTRTLAGNGLPSHGTGDFPVPKDSRVYPYVNENYTIRTQILGITLPSNPVIAQEPSCLPHGKIGVLISGATLYSAATISGLDAGARALEDVCGGHPDEKGEYHYHRESNCVLELVEQEQKATSTLIGYALDGFGIYSSQENNENVTNQDLDECHGHIHDISWDNKTVEMYHYHMTDEYPYSLGCFKGNPIPN